MRQPHPGRPHRPRRRPHGTIAAATEWRRVTDGRLLSFSEIGRSPAVRSVRRLYTRDTDGGRRRCENLTSLRSSTGAGKSGMINGTKKLMALFSVTGMLAVGLVTTTAVTAHADVTVDPSIYYEIFPRYFNPTQPKCLDVPSGSSSLGLRLQVFHCHGF